MNQVVVLSPDPPTAGIRALIESPKYRGRVTYVQVACARTLLRLLVIFQVCHIGYCPGSLFVDWIFAGLGDW